MIRRAARSTSSHGVPTVAGGHRRRPGPRAARRRPRRSRPAASPSEHAAGDVAAVAVHRAAEVAQHDLAGARSPGRRRGGAGLAALAPAATMAKLTLSWPSAMRRAEMSVDTAASVRPTSGISPACSCAATRSAAAPAARRASISAASLTHRAAGRSTSTARRELGAGQVRQQLDEEAGPHLVADGGRGGAPAASPATIAIGSSVSPHGCSVNTPGCSTTRGASSSGTTSVASPSRGSDEHRQPLERHRLVAGEVRQVVARPTPAARRRPASAIASRTRSMRSR